MGKKSRKIIAHELRVSAFQANSSTQERLDSHKNRLLLKRVYDKSNQPLLSTISDITDIFVRELSLQSDEISNRLPDAQLKENIESRLFELDRFFLEYKSVVAEIESFKQKAHEAAATDKQKLPELISQREVIGNLLINSIYYLINTDQKTELLIRLICKNQPEKTYYLMKKFAEYLVSVENGVGFQADKLFKIFTILIHYFVDVQFYDYSFMKNPAEKRGKLKDLLEFILAYGPIEHKQQYTAHMLENDLRQPTYARQGMDIYSFYTTTKSHLTRASVHTINEQFGIKIRPYLSMGLISVEETERLLYALIPMIENLLPHAPTDIEVLHLFNLLVFCENLVVDSFLHTHSIEEASELLAKKIYIRCYELEQVFFQKSPRLKQVSATQAQTSRTSIQIAQASERMKTGKWVFPQDLFLTVYLTGLAFSTIQDLHSLEELQELQRLAAFRGTPRIEGIRGQEVLELEEIESLQTSPKLQKLQHLRRHLRDCERSMEYFADTQITAALSPAEKHQIIKTLGQFRQKTENFALANLSLEELSAFLKEVLSVFTSLTDQSASPALCVGGILYFRLLELVYNCEMLTCHIVKKLSHDIDLIIPRFIGNDPIDIRRLKKDTAFFFEEVLPQLEQLFKIIVLPLPVPIHVEEFRSLTIDAIDLDTLDKKPGKIAKEALSCEKVLFYQNIFLHRKYFLDGKNKVLDTHHLVAAKYLLELPPIGRLATLCEQLVTFDLSRRQPSRASTISSNLSTSSQRTAIPSEPVLEDTQPLTPGSAIPEMGIPATSIEIAQKTTSLEKDTPVIAESPKADTLKQEVDTTASKNIPPTIQNKPQTLTLDDSEFVPAKKSKNARRRQKEKEKKEHKATFKAARKVPLQSLDDFLLYPAASLTHPTVSTVLPSPYPPSTTSAQELPSLTLQSAFNQNRSESKPIHVKELALEKKLATFHQNLQKTLEHYYPGSKLLIIGTAAFQLTSNPTQNTPKFCNINFALAIQKDQRPSGPGLSFKEIGSVKAVYFPYLQYEKYRASVGLNFSIVILPPAPTPCLISGLNTDFAHCGIYIELETKGVTPKYVAYAMNQTALESLQTNELISNYNPETLVREYPLSLLRAGHFLNQHNLHWPPGDEGAVKLGIKHLSVDEYPPNNHICITGQLDITR